jgi:polyisoprenoid-binding protein YceI
MWDKPRHWRALVALTVCAWGVAVASACKKEKAPPVADKAPEKPAISIPVPAVPKIATWELDPENSSVAFVSMHVHSKVRGMFAQPSGTVLLDEETPARSKVEASIDIKLISTGVEERDTHLKGPDFFDAAKFPVATFVSTNVSRSSATAYSVTGNLSISLTVKLSPPFNHAGGIRRGAEATASLDRRDFGINWDFPGEGSGVVVGDNIELTINTELVLRPASGDGTERRP